MAFWDIDNNSPGNILQQVINKNTSIENLHNYLNYKEFLCGCVCNLAWRDFRFANSNNWHGACLLEFLSLLEWISNLELPTSILPLVLVHPSSNQSESLAGPIVSTLY